MCGIVAILKAAQRDQSNAIKQQLLEGLQMLLNRGYDSCGVCLSGLDRWSWKAASRNTHDSFEGLEQAVTGICPENMSFVCGMGHTRWKTHGGQTDENAHPHASASGRYSVVHNGIISNCIPLKADLCEQGYSFQSETDTEVVVALMDTLTAQNPDSSTLELWLSAVNMLEGTWSLVLIDHVYPDCLFVAKHGSPLLMAYSEDENDGRQVVNQVWLSSEPAGFGLYAQKYLDLPDGTVLQLQLQQQIEFREIRVVLPGKNESITVNEYQCLDDGVSLVQHQHQSFDKSPVPFDFWTDKEIHEQPQKLWEALNRGGRLRKSLSAGSSHQWNVKLGGLERVAERLQPLQHLLLVGCGTSYHAARMALPVFRSLECFVTVQALDAGEMNLSDLPRTSSASEVGLVVVSQSGETKDCQRVMSLLEGKHPVIGVVNVVGSWIARQADCGIYLNAGREVGVASTKSFTSQVVVLCLLALWFAQTRQKPIDRWTEILNRLPNLFQQNLAYFQQKAETLVDILQGKTNMFLLGRGFGHPLSLEGALKIKELTYQNSEGYSGGALKHGPFALIDETEKTPIFLHVWKGPHQTAMLSAAEQVYCRGATTIVLYNDTTLTRDLSSRLPEAHLVLVRCADELSASLVSVMLYQFVALKLSQRNGHNPDYPRNLAKVVTVDG